MATNLAIDDRLIEEAKSLGNHRTKKGAVTEALQEYIQRRKQLEILNIFHRHWDNDNRWMLHILTKSHLILNHLDKLKDMKHMVQVEISFSTPYENQLRSLELYTPSIKKRLDTIERLSNEGIFVRVMAMPFFGDRDDLLQLKLDTFNSGAKALKNKGLNYYKI